MKPSSFYAMQNELKSLHSLVVILLEKLGGRVEIPAIVVAEKLQGLPTSHEFTTGPASDVTYMVAIKLVKHSQPLGEAAKTFPIRTPLESSLVGIGWRELEAEVQKNNAELDALRFGETEKDHDS